VRDERHELVFETVELPKLSVPLGQRFARPHGERKLSLAACRLAIAPRACPNSLATARNRDPDAPESQAVNWNRVRAAAALRLAPDSVAIGVETVGVGAGNLHRPLHIARPVPTPSRAVNVGTGWDAGAVAGSAGRPAVAAAALRRCGDGRLSGGRTGGGRLACGRVGGCMGGGRRPGWRLLLLFARLRCRTLRSAFRPGGSRAPSVRVFHGMMLLLDAGLRLGGMHLSS
jgi:hypothetical protein